ncbi:hypothetical protein FAIPA1_160067 [Frankia sp. AiPs1]
MDGLVSQPKLPGLPAGDDIILSPGKCGQLTVVLIHPVSLRAAGSPARPARHVCGRPGGLCITVPPH